MAPGIHVEVVVDDVEGCPVASVGEAFEVESISTAKVGADGGGVVGEVTVRHAPGSDPEPSGTDRVFDDGSRSVHRFRNEDGDCPCGRIPDYGCPIRDVRADSGSLVFSFLASDLRTLRRIVADLRSCCGTVRVRRLTRSTPGERPSLLFVDRTAFTDRQYEVLLTAHEMGYFDTPKRADSVDVAAELDISVATFSEHLSVAQGKLLDQLLAV